MTIWERIKAFFKRAVPAKKPDEIAAKPPPIENVSPIDLPAQDPTPWMTVAHREIGQKEIAGSKHNPRIVKYHSFTTLKATEDEIAWCASFVCFCLETSGYKSTKNAWARSFLNLGAKLAKGRYGAICVFSRGANSGHVGFYLDETDTQIYVLGGNQGNSVSKAWYNKDRLLGVRWPVEKHVETKQT